MIWLAFPFQNESNRYNRSMFTDESHKISLFYLFICLFIFLYKSALTLSLFQLSYANYGRMSNRVNWKAYTKHTRIHKTWMEPIYRDWASKKNCSQHCFIHPPFEHFSPISKKIDFFYVFFTTKNIELGLSISKYWLVVMVVMVVMVIIANCRYLT